MKLLLLDMHPAMSAGNARQDFAEQAKLKEYGEGSNSPAQARDNHKLGAVGEYAAAMWFDLPWDAQVGKITGIDVANLFEVRTRRCTEQFPEPELAIRPKDKADLPYLLARVSLDGYVCALVGWLYGREGIVRAAQLKLALDPRRQCYFVPGPYRPLSTLETWIEERKHGGEGAHDIRSTG